MSGNPRNDLAARLVGVFFPDENPQGVMHSIREQVLADALQASVPPLTLRGLQQALEADPRCRTGVARELLAALRRRAGETPDLPLERLADGSSHQAKP